MVAQLENFTPPHLGVNTIKRKSVVAQINELSGRGMLFIHAPAGYGKTTAAVQWLQGKKNAWFTLDDYYLSPAMFYWGVLKALTVEFDIECIDVTLECMLTLLQKQRKWPDALVIDDFHLSSDHEILRALPLIRARIPANTAFIILSRNPPPEWLNDQMLKGTVKQFTDLQFSKDEIVTLFSKNGIPITQYDAGVILNKTYGWAAALAVFVMSNRDGYVGIFDKETLYNYLETNVFGNWDDNILKKCSICDTLHPGLCAAITGEDSAWEIITSLAKKMGLVSKLDESTYRFHALLKEFLGIKLDCDDSINKPLLYKTAAVWYKDNGDWLRALDMAAKTGDIGTLEQISRFPSDKYDSSGFDVVKFIRFVEHTLLLFPVHIIEQYPHLSGYCFIAALLSRPISEAYMWADMLERQMSKGLTNQSNVIAAAFRRAVDPRYASWHVPNQFKRIHSVLPATAGQGSHMISVSLNFPFFHKAQRDYTDISRELTPYISEFISHLGAAAGPVVKIIAALIESGVYYERGELMKAETIAEATVRDVKHFSPELRFCTYVLYNEIQRVQGKKNEPEIIGDMIESTGALYLSANYNSYMTVIRLYNGDIDTAEIWLKHNNADSVIKLYKIHQYFTTARALIVKGKLRLAENLLAKLAAFSQDYHRNTDYIEAATLQAVCLWRMKRTDESVKRITAALMQAAKLQLIMPIAKEGDDVLPVLQKILNRLKYGYDADVLDRAFVNTVFMKARVLSQYTRGMLSKNVESIKFSQRQLELLGYLATGISRKEIAQKMGVTIYTVDDHLRKMHEKLKVTNTYDLLQKAHELGFGSP